MLGNIHIFPQEKKQASRMNNSRRNYRHTIVKMEIKEEPCRIKVEDAEEQIDLVEVNEDKHYHFKNEDGNISQTENCFIQKRTQKSGVKGPLT
ncbi:hypothetical protein PO909_007593, partial [Leuciscus waleckii]